jgi:hypothetical protein
MRKLLAAVAVSSVVVTGVALVPPADAKLVQESNRPDRAWVLQHKLTWMRGRANRLEHRNAVLHRFIDRMRRQEQRQQSQPAASSTPSSSAPTPAPTSYSGGVLTDAEVTSYLRAAGFPESAIPQMLYYSHRESGNDPTAINSASGACGLFQLYPCSGGSAWLDPATNARLAYEKYQASGFAPWGG